MTKIYFDVYAIKLTEENIPQIEEAAKPLGWTLDHLQDNMECNADLIGRDTILFLKLYQGTAEIATFNDQPDEHLADYRFTDELDPKFGIFHKIEKI